MNQNIIQISHLSKTYKDGTVALEDINLNQIAETSKKMASTYKEPGK